MKQSRKLLFPLPRNRRRPLSDAEHLLHAICVAIRDHGTHAELRKLISHVPRIMNRAPVLNQDQRRVAELENENGELLRRCSELRSALNHLKNLPAPVLADSITTQNVSSEARESTTVKPAVLSEQDSRGGQFTS